MICIWHANRVPDPVLRGQPWRSRIKNIRCLSVLVTILEPAHNALCLPPNFCISNCMRMLLGMEDLKTTVYAKFDWGGRGGVGLRECTMGHSKIENHLFPNTVKPLLSGHLRVVKIAQCLLTINIQRLLCTVIKLHVVKEAIQRSSLLPFICL